MLAALVVVLRSLALISGGHRAVALENLAVVPANLDLIDILGVVLPPSTLTPQRVLRLWGALIRPA